MKKSIPTLLLLSLLLCSLPGIVHADILFGPVTCLRQSGAPSVYTYPFNVAAPGSGFILKVYNGGLEDTLYERVSSSVVTLNGATILGPHNFNQSVDYLEVPVSLASQNTLSVEVRGKPGGAVILKIYPLLVINQPLDGQVYRQQPISISGTLYGAVSSVSANGIPGSVTGSTLSVAGVPLAEGNNIITATAVRADGSQGQDSVLVYLDTAPPAVSASQPPAGAIIAAAQPIISAGFNDALSGIDLSSVSMTLDGAYVTGEALIGADSIAYTPSARLADGLHQVTVAVRDRAGNSGAASWSFTVDATPPGIVVTAPADGATVDVPSVDVTGTVDDEQASVTVNGVAAQVSGGAFSMSVPLSIGPNSIIVTATDPLGNGSTVSLLVTYTPPPPTVTLTADPQSILSGQSGTLAWTSTHADTAVLDNGIGLVATSGALPIAPGASTTYTITVTGPGGTATAQTTVTVAPTGVSASIEASPATVQLGSQVVLSWSTILATSAVIDQGIGLVAASGMIAVQPEHTTTYTLTAAGSEGVAGAQVTVVVLGNPAPQPEGSFGERYQDLIPPDAVLAEYDPPRFAVITGTARNRDDQPLYGVAVTILDHPEYGTVFTDFAGGFSLPVEGGTALSVEYRLPGFLPAQRQVEAPWNDIAVVETVVLIPVDDLATEIILDGNPQSAFIHRGSTTTTDRGSRSATVVITGDTRAYAQVDGAEVELTSFTVRATEYQAPEEMPQVLPPTSAFTYCVDLAVDGVSRVRFSQPVVVYVDNFLGFPVGAVVPAGYFDPALGVWVPELNGKVVRLLDTDVDGIVDALDAGDDGLPDDLDGDGLLNDEVAGLGDPGSYAPGSTFWRVALSHFTPHDFNFGWMWAVVYGQISPNPEGAPNTGDGPPPPNSCGPGIQPSNSFIDQRREVYHEDLPLAGTDLTLHYASDRVPGRLITVTIPASGATVPDSLVAIHVIMDIAGRRFKMVLPDLPNQKAEFAWDGLDYLGRPTGGSTLANIAIGFEYVPVYMSAADASVSFARGGVAVYQVRVAANIILWKRDQLMVRHAGVMGDIAAGWTLSNHHQISEDGQVLYRGDGSQSSEHAQVMRIAAGQYQYNAYSDCPGWSWQQFCHPMGVAVDGAGNLYTSDDAYDRVRKVGRDGTIVTVAGSGAAPGYRGDGGPATQAVLNDPRGLAVDAAGNLYIVDRVNQRIRKVDTQGIITTVVGTGVAGFSGDEGPANQARIDLRGGTGCALAVDSIGNLYIADTNNQRVRKVDVTGRIYTVAGSGVAGNSGNGGRALLAKLNFPAAVAVDDAGNLFIADKENHQVRMVNPSGIITTVAGNGGYGFSGDGGPALAAQVPYPTSLACDHKGNLYILMGAGRRVRRVNRFGVIATVVGIGTQWGGPIEGAATLATLNGPSGIATDRAGNLYISDTSANVVHRVTPQGAVTDYAAGTLTYAEEGGVGLVFNAAGRHIATTDLATGVPLLSFGYQGRALASVSDTFGRTVTIQRDGAGKPTGIVSPEGIVTSLTIDGTNHLRRVDYPDGTGYAMEYTPDGLMTDEYDPRGSQFTHRYDGTGRLAAISDPEGGLWSYAQSRDAAGAVTRTVTSAEGNVTAYLDRWSTNGVFSSTATLPEGTSTTFTLAADRLSATETLACGMSLGYKYDLDALYGQRYLREVTETTGQGLVRRSTLARGYTDTNADGIKDKVTELVSVNGKTMTTVNETLSGSVTTTSPLGRAVTLSYDPGTLLGQSVSVPGLLPVSYGYDGQGRLTGVTTGSRTVTMAYDPNGYPDYLVTPDGKTIDYTYDVMGRLTDEVLPGGEALHYEYDGNGNLTLLRNPGNIAHQFGYTANDQRSSLTAPLSGSYVYRYDWDRRFRELVFPSGRTISNVYAGGVLDYTVTPEGTIDYSWDCGSRVSGILRGGESIALTYDARLVKTDTRAGLLSQVISYGYDGDFRLRTMTYAGASQSFAYDNDGLLITSDGYTITRDAQNGLPTTVTGGALSLSRSFSGYGELDGTSFTVNGIQAYALSIPQRDNARRIRQRVETIAGESITWDYVYDVRGRLTDVSRNGVAVEHYEYDGQGNRLLETNALRGVEGRISSYSIEDHLLTSGTDAYQWDIDGFLDWKSTASGITDYTYSSRGELLDAVLPDGTVISYEHDPVGRRIAKRVNGVVTEKYLWADRTSLLAVYDGSNNLTARFVYADARMPVSMTQGGQTYYLAYDQVGSLRAISDASGVIIKSIDYDSFGNVLSDSNPPFTVPFGFAGGLYDTDTKLVRFGFRDYDPAIGRWSAKDPIDFAGGDANLYGYCLGDPVNFSDGLGLRIVAGSPDLSDYLDTPLANSNMVQYLDSLPQDFIVKYGYAQKGPQYQRDKCGGGTVTLPNRADYPAIMGSWPGAPMVTSQYRSMTQGQIILTNIAHELGHAYFTTRYNDASENSAIAFENVIRGKLGIGAVRHSELNSFWLKLLW